MWKIKLLHPICIVTVEYNRGWKVSMEEKLLLWAKSIDENTKTLSAKAHLEPRLAKSTRVFVVISTDIFLLFRVIDANFI